MSRLTEPVERVEHLQDMQSLLEARFGQAKAAREKLEPVRGELFETACHVDQRTLDQPVRLYNWFITLNSQLQSSAYATTQQHGEVFTNLSG